MNDTLLPIIREQQLSIVASVEALKIDIVNPDTAEKAGFYLGKVKTAQKDLEALRKSLTDPLEKKKKGIIAEFKKPEATLCDIEMHLKGQLLKWSAHLEAERKKEQEALAAKVKAQQEECQRRIRDEAKAVLEDDPFAFDEAEALEQEAATLRVAEPILPQRKTIPFNASIREDWTFVITDEKAFWAYVMDFVKQQLDAGFKMADRSLPILINEKMLGEMARKLKGDASVPGVRFYAVKGLNARSA